MNRQWRSGLPGSGMGDGGIRIAGGERQLQTGRSQWRRGGREAAVRVRVRGTLGHEEMVFQTAVLSAGLPIGVRRVAA
jgi:hypothetical protein